MVNFSTIPQKYFALLDILNTEVLKNESINELIDYIRDDETLFLKHESKDDYQRLYEIARSINRFSHEFAFSDEYNAKIRASMYELFDCISENSKKFK